MGVRFKKNDARIEKNSENKLWLVVVLGLLTLIFFMVALTQADAIISTIEVSNIQNEIDKNIQFNDLKNQLEKMENTERSLLETRYEAFIEEKERQFKIIMAIIGAIVLSSVFFIDLYYKKTFVQARNNSWTENGKPMVMSANYIDVSKQQLLNDDVYKNTEKYKSIIEISNTGVWEYDIEKNHLWCSDAYFKMLGYEPTDYQADEVNNLNHVWTYFIHPDDVENAVKKFNEFVLRAQDDFYENHFQMKRKNGEWAWIWSRGKIMINQDHKKTKFVVGTHIDVTEMKRSQEKIDYLTYHDPLTGLHNRRYYEEKLKEHCGEKGAHMSLVVIDVNGLKLVNDAFGHQSGDQLLIKVSKILKDNKRIEDIIARIDGDEFVIILPKSGEVETEQIINQIMESFEMVKNENIPISISSGWATKQDQEDCIEHIFKRAEDKMYHNKATERKSLRNQSIQMIMQTLIEKTPREEAHSQRVSDLCVIIGEEMKFSTVELKSLHAAGLLHDIGKIGISNDILDKKESLNEQEWIEIKKHPKISFNILSSVNEYGLLAEIVLSHHERWDGKGYPNGLMGEDIPKNSRIIALADSYDAMVSDRPYRKGMEKEKALKIIENEAGKQFDPDLVKLFLDKVMKNYI